MMPRGQAGRGSFPPLARARIENLACSEPSASGLEVTHWSARTLEQVIVEKEIVTEIHYTSVALILRQADLQPHRQRYWKTTVWNAEAIERAARILWCYERADWLWERDEVVICLDEKPNLQVLQRAAPKQLMAPGRIERQEFEYHRHGTLNLLVGMSVHNGQMGLTSLERNDGTHFRPAVQQYLERFAGAKRVHLILDNGSSHTSADTQAFFADLDPRVRVLFTPPHASWLNQAELLLRAYGRRYVQRGDWCSRDQCLAHLLAGADEYNLRFAHPFAWSWTRHDFHRWVEPRRVACIQGET